jgi:hypothetical protein
MQKEAIVANLRTTPAIYWRSRGKLRNPSAGIVRITANTSEPGVSLMQLGLTD